MWTLRQGVQVVPMKKKGKRGIKRNKKDTDLTGADGGWSVHSISILPYNDYDVITNVPLPFHL